MQRVIKKYNSGEMQEETLVWLGKKNAFNPYPHIAKKTGLSVEVLEKKKPITQYEFRDLCNAKRLNLNIK